MKFGNANYEAKNSAAVRELQTIVGLDFDGTAVYFASHTRPAGLTGTVYEKSIKNLSSSSQRIVPFEGRSEIGTISFDVVDLGGSISAALRTFLNSGIGTRGRLVRLFSGFSGLAWADFRLEQTQVIAKSITLSDGVYKFQCQDIQRELRKDIFAPEKTRISANVAIGDTVISVYDASNFKPVWHGPSFSDSPGTLAAPVGVYYFKIKYQNGWEIVKATGKTANSFTGCTRGALGTTAVAHTLDPDANEQNAIEVEEVFYIELPALKMAYALMTGKLIGQPHTLDAASGTYKDELPIGWHVGIDPAFVVLDSFTSQGSFANLKDLYDPANDGGLILRVDNHEKTDGKKFIEKELFLLSGVFPLVGADGRISIKRMASVLTDASYTETLDPSCVVDVPAIEFAQDDIHNDLSIEWGYIEKPGLKGFQRTHRLIDQQSIAKHGNSKPYTLKFRALHAALHTRTTLEGFFSALRDRHAGPPIMTSLQLLPSKNRLEVGDIVRVRLPMVRDYTGNITTLDRSFEVQQVQIDQDTQKTTVKLFGSSAKAAPIDYNESTQLVLPDAWYTQTGAQIPNVNGSGALTINTTLADGVYYHAGDLTIPAGLKLYITGTARLHVRGTLTVFGEIDGVGRSGASGAAYFGTTISGGGIHLHSKTVHAAQVRSLESVNSGITHKGQIDTLPPLQIVNNAGALQGLPTSLNGTSGGKGGDYTRKVGTGSTTIEGVGGAGGAGGAGLILVCRGLVFGAGGKINTSGADGAPGGSGTHDASGGAGGAPGACLILFDGPAVVPLFDGAIVANQGNWPVSNAIRPSSPGQFRHYTGTYRSYYEGKPAESLWLSAFRFAFIPQTIEPYADHLLPNSDSGGNPVFTGYLTNESHTLPAASDGTVSDYSTASGVFHIFENGLSVVPVFQVQSFAGMTISIDSAGAYSVSAMSADIATATLRATYNSNAIDKVFNVTKSRGGANAQLLYLTSTAQTFTYDTTGAALPPSQTITFTANLQNLSGTAAFACTLYDSSGSSIGTPTLGGSGNSRTLTNAQFGSAAYAKVVATLSGFSDTMTAVRVKDGAQGAQGNQGIQGPPGADGTPRYTWIKYADDSSGGGMTDLPDGKWFLGIAYNKTTQTESTNPADYQWSQYRGQDGVPGATGANGQTYWTWIKYADDSSGNGLTDLPAGKKYFGIAHNKTTQTESTNPADYQWSLMKGTDGVGLVFEQATQPTNADAQAKAGRDLAQGDSWLDNTNGILHFFTGTIWKLFRYTWIQTADRPTTIGGINENEGLRTSTQQIGGIFSDSFDDPNCPGYWQNYSGGGEISRVAISDSLTGGYCLRVGNGSGNDQACLLHKRLLPFDQNRLYRFRIRARKLSGSGTAYFGFAGVASDGVTFVSKVGSNTYSNQHYIAATGVNLPGGWTEYTGYLRGTAATGSGSSGGTSFAPSKAHSSVRYLRPLLLVNYSAAAGITEVDYFEIEDALAQAGVVSIGSTGFAVAVGLGASNDYEYRSIQAGDGISMALNASGDTIVIGANATEVNHISLGSVFSTTSSTVQKVTGFSLVTEASTTYLIEGIFSVQTATTSVGIALHLSGNGTTVGRVDLIGTSGAAAAHNNTYSVGLSPANTAQLVRYSAVFTSNGSSGVADMYFASSINGSNAQINAGSTMTIRKIKNKTTAVALTLQSLTFSGGSYSTYVNDIGTAVASTNLIINNNGTWAISADNGSVGNWGTPTTGGAGSGYECRITATYISSGIGTVNNPCANWTPISSGLSFFVQVSSSRIYRIKTVTVTVEIRKIGTTTPVSTATGVNLTAEALGEDF